MVDVLTIPVQVSPPSMDDSQDKTFPVLPLKVMDPLFPAPQTVAALAVVPPTDTASMDILADVEFADAHEPLFTTA